METMALSSSLVQATKSIREGVWEGTVGCWSSGCKLPNLHSCLGNVELFPTACHSGQATLGPVICLFAVSRLWQKSTQGLAEQIP